MNPQLWIDRKEIAFLTGLSLDIIRCNEEALGLLKIKRQISRKVILYPRIEALKALKDFMPQAYPPRHD